MALAIRHTRASSVIQRILVSAGVDDAPERSAESRHHSDDTPVRSEVLDAPDDGDDNGRQGEGSTIAESHEGGA